MHDFGYNLHIQSIEGLYMGSNNQPRGDNPTLVTGIVFSIIEIVFVPLLYGIIPLIFTIMANNAWKSGDYEDYKSKSHTAKILLIVGGIVLAVECVVVLGGFAYLFWSMVTSGF